MSGWDVVSEYAHLYPDRVRKDTAPSIQTVTKEELAEAEREQPKVAQKPRLPIIKGHSDRKKAKKPIDNGQTPGYSDQRQTPPELTEDEKRIMDLLDGECLVDDLVAKSGMPTGKVLSGLTMLQIKGLIRQLPGKRVTRS